MTNPTISSQLFHFTGVDKIRGSFKPDDEAFNTLISILKSRVLQLRPNTIDLVLPKGVGIITNLKANASIACLTETPIQFIHGHILKYGKFGIGFDVNWALRNGGHNVIYCDRKAPNSYAYTISELGNTLYFNGMLAHDKTATLSFFKLTFITEDFEFRDEREWRFIQAPKIIGEIPSIEFFPEDLKTIVCPESFINQVKDSLKASGFDPDFIPTEKCLHENCT